MDRARAIVIEGDRIALMQRSRAGERFFVFPGGGIEPGELPEIAARREVLEEIGLEVEIEQLVAVGMIGGEEQTYFLARVLGGALGPGTGEEYDGDFTANGTYQPVWMPLARLPELPLYPVPVKTLVIDAWTGGWPSVPLAFIDGYRWEAPDSVAK